MFEIYGESWKQISMTKQNRIVMASHRRYFGYNVRTKTREQSSPIYIPK